jgi:hypothetical protein
MNAPSCTPRTSSISPMTSRKPPGTLPDRTTNDGTRTYTLTPLTSRASVVRVWLDIFIASTGTETVDWPIQAGRRRVRSISPPNPPNPVPVRFFATDQRDFSSDPDASARVRVVIELFLGGAIYALADNIDPALDEGTIRVGTTTEVNGRSGSVIRSGEPYQDRRRTAGTGRECVAGPD